MRRIVGLLCLLFAPGTIAAQVTTERGLLEPTLQGTATFDPTQIGLLAAGNYFIRPDAALTGEVAYARFDPGFDAFTAVQVMVGGLFLPLRFGERFQAGVGARIGYADVTGSEGDGIYALIAALRQGTTRYSALYHTVTYEASFDGGHVWVLGSVLVPGWRDADGGTFFQPQQGRREIAWRATYLSSSEVLDLAARFAPFITRQVQAGADLAFSRDGQEETAFTAEGLASYHVATGRALIPYLGPFVGYWKFAGVDGTVTYGARGGVKLSRNEETSIFLEALYRGFSEDAYGGLEGLELRLGTNIYPR